MSMLFLVKNIVRGVVISCCAIFVFTTIVYSCYLSARQVTSVGTVFYILVSGESHVAASVENIKLQGGAGYVLSKEDKKYVVLSVHTNENDCTNVYARLLELGVNVSPLQIGVKTLYFPKSKKGGASTYIGALEILKGYICVLEQCIILLDSGETQENVKRILKPVKRQLQLLSDSYKSKYWDFSIACGTLALRLGENTKGIIYAKDLRYTLCSMVDEYLGLCNPFLI